MHTYVHIGKDRKERKRYVDREIHSAVVQRDSFHIPTLPFTVAQVKKGTRASRVIWFVTLSGLCPIAREAQQRR